MIDNYSDIKVGDIIETFEEVNQQKNIINLNFMESKDRLGLEN